MDLLSDVKRRVRDVGRRVVGAYDPVAAGEVFSHDGVRRLQALVEGADYARARMGDALASPSKREVFQHSLEHAPAEGMVLEFGVWSGRTINAIAGFLGPSRAVDGFDSFEGLPEDWFGWFRKGSFDTKGRMPEVLPNVTLHKGWFENTLPGFARANPGPIAFLHVDCDLYSSTRTIFEHLGDRIVPGTVILFDEYFNYPGWQEHEYKAFQELVAARSLRYRYLAYNTTEWNASVQIL